MFIMMLVYIFFFGGGYYVVPLLRCYAYSFFFFFFFYGAYFLFLLLFFIYLFIIIIIIIIIFFFFENHGLGLGTALFRLGIQVGPAMQKNFNLSWKFFQIFRENLGFETCFKFQFGDSLAWMTIQVSNRG
jgi:hypothetical protein